VAASVVAPRVAWAIPGTTAHNQFLQGQAAERVGQDQDAIQKELQTQQLQTEIAAEQQKTKDGTLLYDKEGNPIGYHTGTGQYMGVDDPRLPTGVKSVLSAAKGKPKQYEFQQTDHGLLRIDKATGEAQPVTLGGKAIGPKVATKTVLLQVGGKPHQVLINDSTGEPIKDLGESGEKAPVTNVNTGTWSPGFDKDKNPILFNSKTGEVKPNTAGITKDTATGKRLGADEQKRADLAKNLSENIDSLEDIAARRPELFGPVAGRWTELRNFIGTNDADITRLEAIKHQLGMVAQGAHGMRASQGVIAAANSLLNGFHNSAEATKAALEAARQSVRTFTDDANNPGASRGPSLPSAPNKNASPANGSGMITVQLPGLPPGKIHASQKAKFLRDNPGAKVVNDVR
jgi:hypothetical protein